jgi:hypothetical protein
MEKFRRTRKMGGEQMSQTYLQELEIEIAELYCNKKNNFL